MIISGSGKGLRLDCIRYNIEKRGGLALSHPKMYFLASQMQQFAGWGRADNPTVQLVTLSNPTLKAGSHVEMDLLSMPPSPMADLFKKVWKAFREALSIEGPLGFTPLWNNPKYPELNKLQGFSTWRQKGVWFFPQIYIGTILKLYAQLCAEFLLPPKGFYQYL